MNTMGPTILCMHSKSYIFHIDNNSANLKHLAVAMEEMMVRLV